MRAKLKWNKREQTKMTDGSWWESTNTSKHVKLYRPHGKKMWVGWVDGDIRANEFADLVGDAIVRHLPTKWWRNPEIAKKDLQEYWA